MTAAKVISWRQLFWMRSFCNNPGTPRVRMNHLWIIIFKHVKHIWGETRAFYLMCTRLQSNWAFWNGNGKKKQRTHLEDTGPRNLQSQWQPNETFDLQLQTVCCGNFNNIVFPMVAELQFFQCSSEILNMVIYLTNNCWSAFLRCNATTKKHPMSSYSSSKINTFPS